MPKRIGACAACARVMTVKGRGLCRRCWEGARATGTLESYPTLKVDVAARLQSLAGVPGECWSWKWRIAENGYGRVTVAGVELRAHRVAYEFWKRPIPEGLVVDHICHNRDNSCPDGKACMHRRCVNPAHLEAVPEVINILRGHGTSALNSRKTHCGSGHEFTESNTRIISGGRRQCRKCRAIWRQQWKARRREQARQAPC